MASNPILKVRNDRAFGSDSGVQLLEMMGVIKVRRKAPVSRERQHTLDIRTRIAHGTPVKGGLGGQKPDQRKVKLAAVVATGEPLLVRKGRLEPGIPKRQLHLEHVNKLLDRLLAAEVQATVAAILSEDEVTAEEAEAAELANVA